MFVILISFSNKNKIFQLVVIKELVCIKEKGRENMDFQEIIHWSGMPSGGL